MIKLFLAKPPKTVPALAVIPIENDASFHVSDVAICSSSSCASFIVPASFEPSRRPPVTFHRIQRRLRRPYGRESQIMFEPELDSLPAVGIYNGFCSPSATRIRRHALRTPFTQLVSDVLLQRILFRAIVAVIGHGGAPNLNSLGKNYSASLAARELNRIVCLNAFELFSAEPQLKQNSLPQRVQVRSANHVRYCNNRNEQNSLQYITDQLSELRAKAWRRDCACWKGAEAGLYIRRAGSDHLASNNYLGLTTHKALRKAALDAVKRYGAGAGAVRTIAGTMKLHMELEEQIATFRTWKLASFSIGFTANAGNGFGGAWQGRLDHLG